METLVSYSMPCTLGNFCFGRKGPMGNNSHLQDAQYYLGFDTLWFPYFEPHPHPKLKGSSTPAYNWLIARQMEEL